MHKKKVIKFKFNFWAIPSIGLLIGLTIISLIVFGRFANQYNDPRFYYFTIFAPLMISIFSFFTPKGKIILQENSLIIPLKRYWHRKKPTEILYKDIFRVMKVSFDKTFHIEISFKDQSGDHGAFVVQNHHVTDEDYDFLWSHLIVETGLPLKKDDEMSVVYDNSGAF